MRALLLLLVGAGAPSIPYEKYQLANGLTVVLSEDHRLPQVAVDLWYHVGAANQAPGRSGFAHLFEHMMFAGSKHTNGDAWHIGESLGATAGANLNGTTDFDRTNYFEVVPSSELPGALWLESDRMGFLLDTVDEPKLDIQRKVVSNERRQGVETVPYGIAEVRLLELLYPLPHPYYDGPIGTLADINSASLDDVKGFFRTYYVPNNAALVIVGDFDPAIAKQLVEKYFAPLPRGADVPRPDVPQPMLTSVVRETIRDNVAQVPRLMLAWNGTRAYAADEPAGDVLATILGGGKASRLYRTLVLDKQVATNVFAYDSALLLGGYFAIYGDAKAGHTVPELLAGVQSILADVKAHGVTAAEVERAKRVLVAQLLRGVERIGGFGGKADQLNAYEMFLGDPGYLPKDVARYEAVTPAQVQAFARKYLVDDRRMELDVEPAQGGKP